jgi:hypothetical protein
MPELIDKLSSWQRQQDSANSINAEIRQDKGQFIDDTGINKKALSVFGQLNKMDDDKREDFLRSWDEHIGDLRAHWAGQSTPDMFDQDEDAPEAVDGDTVVPFDGETAEFDAAADEALSAAE